MDKAVFLYVHPAGWYNVSGEDGQEMLKEWKRDLQYDDHSDLLYIRLDSRKQPVTNRRLSEDIVLDIGENDKIVGIEILDASRHINLGRVLPRKRRASSGVVS